MTRSHEPAVANVKGCSDVMISGVAYNIHIGNRSGVVLKDVSQVADHAFGPMEYVAARMGRIDCGTRG